MLKQVDGVFNAVCEVLGQESFDSKVELTKEQKAQVADIVAEGIHEGKIAMSERAREKYSTLELIRKDYVSGLVNNHLRKDLRLNGGTPHQIKNPGSRTGSQDETIKAMRALRKTLTDAEEIAVVDSEIEKRIAHLKSLKQETVEINVDALPESLKQLVNSES